MKLNHLFSNSCRRLSLLALLLLTLAPNGGAAESQSAAEKQPKLIAVLQSGAAPGEKAIACKQLAVYGGKDAVPALAPLLIDPSLSSWARIALEAITDPSASDALREALAKAQGRVLIGVINSVAVKRDPQAVPALVAKLKDTDVDVASAAAVALGRIGGDQATQALSAQLASAPEGVRSAVAQGCILCAEHYLADHKGAKAIELYDAVRKATLPKQRLLEATRGAILARGSAGIPLLLEQLRSTDKAYFGIGLRTARELPGVDVSRALVTELGKAAPERQVSILLALSDRTDPTVLPAVLSSAKTGSTALRIAAVGVIERMATPAGCAVLLAAATDADAGLARAAKTALAGLPGKTVDADLLAQLPKSSGKQRLVLIELAGQRRIEGAVASIGRWAEDPDPAVRGAALETLGSIGGDAQVGDLVKLIQKSQAGKARSEIEKPLLSLAARRGVAAVRYLLPLATATDVGLRTIAVHALASVGGAQALAAVTSATKDQDEGVQDEAVRALSTWASNWPEDSGVAEPLLALAKSGKKVSHQVLGLRGYLQYLQGDKKLRDGEKIAKLKELTPIITRPEEKRLAIATAGGLPVDGVIEVLTGLAADPAVAEDAYGELVNLAGKTMAGVSVADRLKALQWVAEKSGNDSTRKRANEAQKAVK